jgi:hypothetical protein
MIGSGRLQSIQWLNVRVRTADGERTMQEAMNDGIVANGLYSFVDSYFRATSLAPYLGYFMKAYQECSLIVPVTDSSITSSTGTRVKVVSSSAPTAEQAGAEIAAAGLGPKPVRAGSRSVSTVERASRFYPAALKSAISKTNNNPFELWPWRPGLG